MLRPIGREVLSCIFSFKLKVPVTNGAAQLLVYQPNSQWNISKYIIKDHN